MYYALTDIQFWLYGVLSFIAVAISCYIPGWLLIKRAEFESKLTEVALSTTIGIVLWAFQGYIFGHLHIRFASYIYLLTAIFIIWKYRKDIWKSLSAAGNELSTLPKVVLFSLVISIFFQLYAHIGSGFLGQKGLGIYFVNAADGMMHLSYIQSLTTQFPPLEPGFAGTQLLNYHYWSDLVFAEFARVWHLPIIHLFFQYIPFILIVLTTLLVIQLIKYLKGTTSTIVIALFLLTFGADASFAFALYFNRTWGETVPALDTAVSFIFNMPQVFSRLILIGNILIFLQWLKTKNNFILLPLILMGASLFGFKVYYGLYFLGGLAFFSLFHIIGNFIQNKKNSKNIFSALGTTINNNKYFLISWVALAILIAAIFLPNNKNTGGLQIEPLAWPKIFLSSENFNYRDWWLRMQVYEEAKNYRNITIYNAIAIVITLISVYGVRLFGLLPYKNSTKNFSKELLLFLIPINIIFVIIGFVFFQVSISGGLNIYNFLITPIFTFNLFLAFAISNIKDEWIRWSIFAVVMALCIPRTYIQLSEYFETYYSQRPSQVVSYKELELLDYLKQTPADSVIQADIRNEYENTTPYVSFFTEKQTYLGGKKLLETHNVVTTSRQKEVQDMFDSQSMDQVAETMKKLNIDYLYVIHSGFKQKFQTEITPTSGLKIAKENQLGIIISTQ